MKLTHRLALTSVLAAGALAGAGTAPAQACVFSPPWGCGIGSAYYHEYVAPTADPNHNGPRDEVEALLPDAG